MKKFDYIAKNNCISAKEVSKFRLHQLMSKKEANEIWSKIVLPNDFVLALCGGTWPKTKCGANFDAVNCWKIDLKRKTLVPYDSKDNDGDECPVPDLKLQVMEF